DVAISPPPDIIQTINLNYRSYTELEDQIFEIESIEETTENQKMDNDTLAPASRVLSMLIDQSVKERASDIHLKPQGNKLRVRFRIDGILRDIYSLPKSINSPLVSRIKLLCGMNIAEKRRPQDGHFAIKLKDKRIDIRVATMNSSHGERVTMRILDKSLELLALDKIGLENEKLDEMTALLRSSFGIVLIGGPTGSGKTTTLHAALRYLNSNELNIMTIEDPIEYEFDDISQMQVNEKAGISFSTGLRSMMRHDPDIILVGEIRDTETARVAVQAALTGHLVLASIHANDATSMLFRLIDMGIEPYLISSTVVGLVAQRMIRCVCENCRTALQPSEFEKTIYKDHMADELPVVYKGTGCVLCANSGFSGRTGIFEIMRMDDAIRKRLLTGADVSEIRKEVRRRGVVSLQNHGMMKVKEGISTIEEVLRCTNNFE
ncbi:MAG: GspE/PulE family protein, partial [Dehalococcoidales bacterium]|nr:GspE/PulE family protein [Dehalococcoidales bacterium]